MSANINNITEDDLTVLAHAAQEASDRGDIEAANALDKLARKANAALTNAKFAGLGRLGLVSSRIKWTEVPSNLI